MFEDDKPKKTLAPHEVGMSIESMSVDELQERIGILEGEIARLKEAIASRQKTRSAAESIFKF